ncbi:MAG: hypothetical protein ABIJ31_08465 [Pseudomonadota bacterium]
MNSQQKIKKAEPEKLKMEKAKLLFKKETERKVFFFMTIIMLLMGILVKLGLA